MKPELQLSLGADACTWARALLVAGSLRLQTRGSEQQLWSRGGPVLALGSRGIRVGWGRVS